MYVTTNSALIWKRVADENQQSVKFLARVSIALLALLLGAGAYAYSAQARFDDLCTTIARESRSAESPSAREMGITISRTYCI